MRRLISRVPTAVWYGLMLVGVWGGVIVVGGVVGSLLLSACVASGSNRINETPAVADPLATQPAIKITDQQSGQLNAIINALTQANATIDAQATAIVEMRAEINGLKVSINSSVNTGGGDWSFVKLGGTGGGAAALALVGSSVWEEFKRRARRKKNPQASLIGVLEHLPDEQVDESLRVVDIKYHRCCLQCGSRDIVRAKDGGT